MSNKLYDITVRADENYSEQEINKALQAVYGAKFFKKFSHLVKNGVYKRVVTKLFESEWLKLPMSPAALQRLVDMNTKMLKKGVSPVLRITSKQAEIVRELSYIALRAPSWRHRGTTDSAVVLMFSKDLRFLGYCEFGVEDTSAITIEEIVKQFGFGIWLLSNDNIVQFIKSFKDETFDIDEDFLFLTADGSVLYSPSEEELSDCTGITDSRIIEHAWQEIS